MTKETSNLHTYDQNVGHTSLSVEPFARETPTPLDIYLILALLQVDIQSMIQDSTS